MTESLKASDVPFKSIITEHNISYSIPRFQRPYSWTNDNAEDFYKDLIDGQNDFFIGSLVLNYNRESEGIIEIIDGQQRMITSTLLLAALRDIFAEFNFSEEASEFQDEFIGKTSIRERQTKYKLITSHKLENFFEQYIQKFPKDEFPANNNLDSEEKRIKENYTYFYNTLKDEITNLDRSIQRDRIYSINDYLMAMKVIRIRVQDESRAYEIFETVNARGAELTVADLLKNTIFDKVRQDNRGRDHAAEQWSKIIDNLDGTGLEVTTFVRYHWLSKYPFVTKKQLYRQIKEKVSDWPSFLDDLVKDSERVNALSNANVRVLELDMHDRRVNEINKSLKGINAVGTTQSYVLLMAILREFERTGFQRIYKIFQHVENFTFFYHGVCKGPGNKVERFWNRKCISLLSDVVEETDIDTKLAAGSTWKNELKSYLANLMSENVFREKFPTNIVYKNSSKARSLVKYFLKRMIYETNPEGLDETTVSLEHILPQNPIKWSLTKQEIKSYVNTIGNLTLINQEMNGSMGNKRLDEKILVMRESGIQMNRDFVENLESGEITTEDETGTEIQQIVPIWNKETIASRTEGLCEAALRIWTL